MNEAIQTIPLTNLALALIPVVGVLVILQRWSLGVGDASYALVRMLVQLLLIGYLLSYIFTAQSHWIVVAVLLVMVSVSSWIALRPVDGQRRRALYWSALISIALCGTTVLFFTTEWVLDVDPWYQPSQVIPLAGMVFANAMNSLSLAVERLESELSRGVKYDEARVVALRTALIPVINSMFAVGLVSLPGMMTGQILSGVSPLIAVRYQIMVMCMIFASAGMTTALFLSLLKKPLSTGSDEQK